MSLEISIQDDIKQAMRSRDAATLSALRLLWAAIKQKHIDDRVDFSDDMIISVLVREKKKRQDSRDCYILAGRIELADREQFEMDIISRYLPESLSESELYKMVEEAFSVVGCSKMSDISAVMSELKPKLIGKADLGQVSRIVKDALSKRLSGGIKEGS